MNGENYSDVSSHSQETEEADVCETNIDFSLFRDYKISLSNKLGSGG